MKLDPDSVLVIFLHTNLAWFGLCFDLRSNLHAARKLTWIYMGINLQAEFFFVFFVLDGGWGFFDAVSTERRPEHPRSGLRRWLPHPGPYPPGPARFPGESGMPYCRVVGEVAGRGRVGQDDVRGVPGAHPRGGRHRPL